MPRQDVPYGGAICRLKERIAEIWDKLGEKLHSINGVEGDAAGDVKIVSGNAAVIITSDQVNHQIEVALDSSQLPAASVSSVNGQSGAVVLDANDIDAGLTPPGTSVAQDLASTKAQLQTVGGLLQQEVLDRQNADSTLQGNINAALATIPGEVSSQIANDATIAQLVIADGQNVKLTGNQNISGVKTVPTEATGTYSQQIANSTKVKNELDNYAPMVRTTGNQTIAGVKNVNSFFDFAIRVTATNVYELFRTTLQTDTHIYYTVFTRYGVGTGKLDIILDGDGNVINMVTDKMVSPGSNDNTSSFFAYKDGSDLVICVGNYTATNNCITISINSLMSGAGIVRSADISYIGTARATPAISTRMLS